MNSPKPAIVYPGTGKVLKAFGEEATFLLSGADTGGRLCMFKERTPPGGGPPPHYHTHEDEWFLPLEGRVEFFIEGEWKEVPMGTSVFAPKNSVHTFRNPGDRPLVMLIQTAPAGFDVFFERCAELFAGSEPPDMARVLEISAEHGIHFVSENGETPA